MLACFRSFSRETKNDNARVNRQQTHRRRYRHTQTNLYDTFSDGSAWSSFFVLQSDLLQRNQVVGQLAATFVHRGVRPLRQSEHGETREHMASVVSIGPFVSSLLYLPQFVQFDVGLQLPKADL